MGSAFSMQSQHNEDAHPAKLNRIVVNDSVIPSASEFVTKLMGLDGFICHSPNTIARFVSHCHCLTVSGNSGLRNS